MLHYGRNFMFLQYIVANGKVLRQYVDEKMTLIRQKAHTYNKKWIEP